MEAILKSSNSQEDLRIIVITRFSSLCYLVIKRVSNTYIDHFITSVFLYNGFLHISKVKYQVEM